MTIQTDSIVLVMIDRLNHLGEPYGLRALVKACRLADKTISKAIRRLEADGYIRVIRSAPRGTRHEYVILRRPDEVDVTAASIHLAERV